VATPAAYRAYTGRDDLIGTAPEAAYQRLAELVHRVVDSGQPESLRDGEPSARLVDFEVRPPGRPRRPALPAPGR
jgi:hypothetical protein